MGANLMNSRTCGKKQTRRLLLALIVIVSARGPSFAKPPAQDAKPQPRIMVHYMPWYEANAAASRWGWHWTMNAFNPAKKVNGQPEIASHYHPLIGPYDSGDRDVLEFHTLLMRLAGIDGVIVDWYGREDFLDYGVLHRNTEKLREQVAKTRLKFAVCYEDQTIPKLVAADRVKPDNRVEHARAEIDWLRMGWFRGTEYLTKNGKPILLSFGHDGLTDDEWETVLSGSARDIVYLSEHHKRKAAAGAFDWPVPQPGVKAQEDFLVRARDWPLAMAVAFPRFHDIYEQARVHKSWGRIDDDGGKTFERALAQAIRSGLPFVQISTWNDWGEGTVIEPSVEFGYRDLEATQRVRRQLGDADFTPTADDLRLPLRLYKLRKSIEPRSAEVRKLDEIAQMLAGLRVKAAKDELSRVESGHAKGQ
jgi:hypothetical protein